MRVQASVAQVFANREGTIEVPRGKKTTRRVKPKSAGERELSVRGKFQPDMARWVLDQISDQEITQELDQKISHVLIDRRRRAEVFLTALVRNHAERIMFLVSRLPDVEAVLLDPERIQATKTSDLIRLVAEMARGVSESSEFIRAFVSDTDLQSEPMPFSGRYRSRQVGGSEDEDDDDDETKAKKKKKELELIEERRIAVSMSVESRQRIGGLLKHLLDLAATEGKDVQDVQDVKVVDAQVTTTESSVKTEKPKKPKKPKKTKKPKKGLSGA